METSAAFSADPVTEDAAAADWSRSAESQMTVSQPSHLSLHLSIILKILSLYATVVATETNMGLQQAQCRETFC